MSEREPIARNEVCPCGSGKKYKRCCGIGAAPVLGVKKEDPAVQAQREFYEQMDPSLRDAIFQTMKRMPRGQMQKLQGLMQKAMKGQDVGQQAQALQNLIPQELQQGIMASLMNKTNQDSPMSEEEARALVAQAASEGKISQEKAKEVLGEEIPKKAEGLFSKWKK